MLHEQECGYVKKNRVVRSRMGLCEVEWGLCKVEWGCVKKNRGV